jgi:ATP-dependent helicase/nuclease subunit A
VQATLAAVLRSAAVAPLLDDDQLDWAGNEVAIAWQTESLRIDRLVAQPTPTGRQWWVLDYKLQHAPQTLASYREQLARYRDAVAASHPGDAVRAAFITGEGMLVPLAE